MGGVMDNQLSCFTQLLPLKKLHAPSIIWKTLEKLRKCLLNQRKKTNWHFSKERDLDVLQIEKQWERPNNSSISQNRMPQEIMP